METTTTKIETTGDRPDDRAQEAEERRERARGIRCFELSVNFDGGWVLVDRPSGRVNAMHEQLDHHQDDISIAPLIYTRGSRDARLQLTGSHDCHAIYELHEWLEQPVGRASINRSVASSKFRENDF